MGDMAVIPAGRQYGPSGESKVMSVPEMFEGIDQDHDGRVDWHEWESFNHACFEVLGQRSFMAIANRWLSTLKGEVPQVQGTWRKVSVSTGGNEPPKTNQSKKPDANSVELLPAEVGDTEMGLIMSGHFQAKAKAKPKEAASPNLGPVAVDKPQGTVAPMPLSPRRPSQTRNNDGLSSSGMQDFARQRPSQTRNNDGLSSAGMQDFARQTSGGRPPSREPSRGA